MCTLNDIDHYALYRRCTTTISLDPNTINMLSSISSPSLSISCLLNYIFKFRPYSRHVCAVNFNYILVFGTLKYKIVMLYNFSNEITSVPASAVTKFEATLTEFEATIQYLSRY